MRNNAREVSCYMTVEEAARFREAAASSKVSLSRYLRQCLLDYRRVTEDLSKPNAFALAETEERLSRGIDAQSSRLAALDAQVQVLSSMIDRLAFISFVHLPEVSAEKREAALASGTKLYEHWRRAVSDLIGDSREELPRSQPNTTLSEQDHEETGNGMGDYTVLES